MMPRPLFTCVTLSKGRGDAKKRAFKKKSAASRMLLDTQKNISPTLGLVLCG